MERILTENYGGRLRGIFKGLLSAPNKKNENEVG
jgi:hypothetical protein